MYDLGDVVPLSVTVTRADGTPEDASEVRLTVTLPDGTPHDVGVVASSGPGVYGYDYPTVQAGRHVARWVATGQNASAFTDVFDVQSAARVEFISLADARTHLKKSAVDDETLRWFITASCQAITDRMGQVAPVTVVHDATRCGRTIVLPKRPVISITSVETLPGLETVPQADRATGIDGWVLDSVEGVLTLTRRFGDVRVLYRAGRSPVPGNYWLAGLELIAHLWRTSQLNPGGGRPAVGVDETVVPGVTFALPYNVRQLLGLDKRPQDEVLVG